MSTEILVTIGALVVSFGAWLVAQKCIGRRSSNQMIKEFVGNVIPLGLLIASLLLYQYQLQHKTEQRLGGLETILSSQQFRDATNVVGPYDISVGEILPNYPTFVRAISREISNTQRRFHVLRIQTQQSSPSGERTYFEETEKRLKKGEIPDYRRLVRAPTEEHVKLYQDLLDRLKDAPTFQMKLWTAEESPVNFDMVVSDNAVILVFGNNVSQGVPAWGICLKGKEVADRLDVIFENLWNKNTTAVLKETRDLDDKRLQNSKELLEHQLVASR